MTVSVERGTHTAPLPGPVLVGQRYEYTIVRKIVKGKTGLYVHCTDTMKRENHMDHGPFTREQAQSMIDARVKRDEALQRAP